MDVTFIPTLETQRDLYAQPVTLERFRWYIHQLTGGTSDIILPIGLVNPMGKQHCAETVARLLDLDAEVVVGQTADVTVQLLPPGRPVSLCLNVIDDLGGGWTNRYFYELELRFGSERGERVSRTRRFVVIPAWTSQAPDRERLRKETRAALYRRARRDVHGPPLSLKAQLDAEGMALRFGGFSAADLPDEAGGMANAAAVAEIHGHSTDFPTLAAFWFGDAIACELGYPQMGLGPWAGFHLALSQALADATDPLQALAVEGVSRP
jgi:hypothetical protein